MSPSLRARSLVSNSIISPEVMRLMPHGKRLVICCGLITMTEFQSSTTAFAYFCLRRPVFGWVNETRRYCGDDTPELAEMAKRADDGDPQRWLELRYRARANDTANVIGLATPEYFRKHFFEKRNPGDIHDDIRLAFQIAGQTRNSNKLFELILARHEIEVRTEAICSDALLDAYIATNDLNSAHGLATSERVDLSVSAEFGLVDALLSAGDTDEARKLIEFLEPTNKLYGAEAIDGFRNR